MDASMWVAKTGLTAQSTRLSVISNNLANVSTVGFKKDRAIFEDLIYQNITQPGGQTDATSEAPTGLMLGTGTRVVGTEKLHMQGSMMSTENALDVEIAGDGYRDRLVLPRARAGTGQQRAQRDANQVAAIQNHAREHAHQRTAHS